MRMKEHHMRQPGIQVCSQLVECLGQQNFPGVGVDIVVAVPDRMRCT